MADDGIELAAGAGVGRQVAADADAAVAMGEVGPAALGVVGDRPAVGEARARRIGVGIAERLHRQPLERPGIFGRRLGRDARPGTACRSRSGPIARHNCPAPDRWSRRPSNCRAPAPGCWRRGPARMRARAGSRPGRRSSRSMTSRSSAAIVRHALAGAPVDDVVGRRAVSWPGPPPTSSAAAAISSNERIPSSPSRDGLAEHDALPLSPGHVPRHLDAARLGRARPRVRHRRQAARLPGHRLRPLCRCARRCRSPTRSRSSRCSTARRSAPRSRSTGPT